MALHGDGFIKTTAARKAPADAALRQLVDSGIPLAMTTDAFRAATFNPWVGISWMVSGRSVSGVRSARQDNRLSRVRGAEAVHPRPGLVHERGGRDGHDRPGHLADFALLDRDYFTVPEDEIKSVTSVLTVMDGRVVFGAQEYSALRAASARHPARMVAPQAFRGGDSGRLSTLEEMALTSQIAKDGQIMAERARRQRCDRNPDRRECRRR
jgi:hypothetical protein